MEILSKEFTRRVRVEEERRETPGKPVLVVRQNACRIHQHSLTSEVQRTTLEHKGLFRSPARQQRREVIRPKLERDVAFAGIKVPEEGFLESPYVRQRHESTLMKTALGTLSFAKGFIP